MSPQPTGPIERSKRHDRIRGRIMLEPGNDEDIGGGVINGRTVAPSNCADYCQNEIYAQVDAALLYDPLQ